MTATARDERHTMSTAGLARVEHREMVAVEVNRFTDEQKKLIRDTCCGGASEHEANALIAIAEERGLNPIRGECFFVKRWDSQKRQEVWAVQVSIDGMRIKAEETGLYCGQDEPEFEYEADGKTVKLARVRIYRRDWERPIVGVARFSEYVQKTKEGNPTRFWSNMPHNQLAKCAEALGLRKAFPKRFSRLYTPEEMAQADREEMTGEVVEQPPAKPPSPPPPALAPKSQMHNVLRSQLLGAASVDALKASWEDVKKASKAQHISLAERAALQDVKDERKKALEAPAVNYQTAAQDALGDNELPASYGGPAQTEEACMFCEGGFAAGEERIEHTDRDGVVGWRHNDCTAFEHR